MKSLKITWDGKISEVDEVPDGTWKSYQPNGWFKDFELYESVVTPDKDLFSNLVNAEDQEQPINLVASCILFSNKENPENENEIQVEMLFGDCYIFPKVDEGRTYENGRNIAYVMSKMFQLSRAFFESRVNDIVKAELKEYNSYLKKEIFKEMMGE